MPEVGGESLRRQGGSPAGISPDAGWSFPGRESQSLHGRNGSPRHGSPDHGGEGSPPRPAVPPAPAIAIRVRRDLSGMITAAARRGRPCGAPPRTLAGSFPSKVRIRPPRAGQGPSWPSPSTRRPPGMRCEGAGEAPARGHRQPRDGMVNERDAGMALHFWSSQSILLRQGSFELLKSRQVNAADYRQAVASSPSPQLTA